ncbi:hypothetical protein GCM10011389_14110 [Pontibacillus salipaludis]|uniref:Uncharacterized protein n=1 Tax=Pontibacillus salipaludis TaxID=1697394 RepID=A0ABQ1PZZ4_9BACI|nr:hypothetical protein GCM10011389_14110 [Pontibacillus salipaludis]
MEREEIGCVIRINEYSCYGPGQSKPATLYKDGLVVPHKYVVVDVEVDEEGSEWELGEWQDDFKSAFYINGGGMTG